MASSSQEKLQPAAHGGYGRQTGPYGGLQGVEFASRCPPDIQKNTRIIAVSGVIESRASPKQDGWFFSDFFLFYQMFRDRVDFPNQLWFSCCSPHNLISQHTRYVHGPENGVAGDRRIVMNKAMLPSNNMAAGFRICEPKDLLERFLATLKSEIAEAAKTNQPVLVLVFGHGKENTSGIFIGCDQGGSEVLTNDRLASVLKREVPTTFVFTSCFSGGWIMKPNSDEYFHTKPKFNHTFLTAAGAENESLSWDVSQTIGQQAGGSVFATCLINSMIIASGDSNNEARSSELGEEKLIKLREDDQGDKFSSTFAALTSQVVQECKDRYGSLWTNHKFSFAAQDDRWAEAWGKRTGLPLGKYKDIWESLPKAPVGNRLYEPAGPLSGSLNPRSSDDIYSIIRGKALRYMSSKPGLDNAGGNTDCHPGFRDLIARRSVEFEELYRLNEILDHRQEQLSLAEDYCRALEIDSFGGVQVAQFDGFEWVGNLRKEVYEASSNPASPAVEKLSRYERIWRRIIQLGLFDEPLPGQGYSYSKPKVYLAFMLTESSEMSLEEIYEKLQNLQQKKLKAALGVARTPLGKEILNQSNVRTLRGRMLDTVGKMRDRLRSLSPRKPLPRD
ncbi:hypothetical protein VTL71DRAFT_6185 [Oculimacula yallundae]|uniref:Peptidase C14 caspase domain-containing protein n=1 Tax=Oculimacula yallundae TaxID=86028 RepID=A0ABR4C282_9HELO